jgi:hypothetical protein
MPRSMQYCRRSSSRVDGLLVGRDGFTVVGLVVVRVGLGVDVVRSVVLVAVGFRVGRWVGLCVGRDVGPSLGTRIVRGGVDVVRGTTGLVELTAGPADGDSSTNFTTAESSGPPSWPITSTAQRLTPANTIIAAAAAYAARRDGAPYRPIGPRTGSPLPSTQNFHPSGAGGQDGSGCQVVGGTQLRRGGDGQLGGTTNRFKENPSTHRRRSPVPGQRHRPCAGYGPLGIKYAPAGKG